MIKPVRAKLQRHPIFSRMIPSRGTPSTDENLAAESKLAVAKPRFAAGNHSPIALALAGKVGASPTPSRNRAANRLGIPGATDAQNDATLQMNVLIRPTRRTPNLSSSTPTGNWQSAYVQLYALER